VLATIKKAATTTDPIRFVIQSGDAIQNGSEAAQLNVSYAPLINRRPRDARHSSTPARPPIRMLPMRPRTHPTGIGYATQFRITPD